MRDTNPCFIMRQLRGERLGNLPRVTWLPSEIKMCGLGILVSLASSLNYVASGSKVILLYLQDLNRGEDWAKLPTRYETNTDPQRAKYSSQITINSQLGFRVVMNS